MVSREPTALPMSFRVRHVTTELDVKEVTMTYGESLRLAWFVAWRHSAFWVLIFAAVLLSALSFPTSEILRVILSGFVFVIFVGTPLGFTPWVFKNLLARSFSKLHLKRIQIAGASYDTSDSFSYRDLLRVAWLYYWRNLIIMYPLALLVGIAFPKYVPHTQGSAFLVLWVAPVLLLGIV